MSTTSTELVTLKFALPAMPGPVDVAVEWIDSLKPRTRVEYGKAILDFARFVQVPEAMALPTDSTEQRRARVRFSVQEEAELERQRALARSAAAELLWGMSPGQANGVMLGYRTSLHERKLSSATIRLRLSALRSMVRTARMLGRIVWTLEVRSPKLVDCRDTRGCGEENWFKVLAYARAEASKGTAVAIRDLAIIILDRDMGMRRAELAGIAYPVDVDLDGRRVALLGKGKSDKEWFDINDRTRAALEAWLRLRGSEPGKLFQRLCPLGYGQGLSGWGVWHVCTTMGRRAGLSRPLRPHGLRHLAISAALDRWPGDIAKVQGFSRHVDVRTLMRYDDRRRNDFGEITRALGEE